MKYGEEIPRSGHQGAGRDRGGAEGNPQKHPDNKTHHKRRNENNSVKSVKRSRPDATRRTWLQPHLRVRMVDNKYRRGKYFREKLVVLDVLDIGGRCVCKSQQGTILDDVREEMLETVVPKSVCDTYVLITSRGSKHAGQLARILEKDRSKCRAYLQLLADRDVCLDLSFDDICEYVGDVEANSHF
uniref:Uncharacterized protein n=1 Tax=Ciona savignyi TaxID=51511 RepID=H2YAG6_CIOSA